MSEAENKSDKESLLLSDEEFASLIERDFDDHGQPMDELAKQKTWTALQNRLNDSTLEDSIPNENAYKNKVSQRFSSLFSLAAAAVLILTLVPLLSSYQVSDVGRIKGDADFPLVNISAFRVTTNGEIQSFPGTGVPGTTIVFKVDSARPYAIALAMAKDDGRPEVRYRTALLQPGVGQLLQTNGTIYGYQLESGDTGLTFCAVVAENDHKLNQRIRLLARIWERLPTASCVQVNAL